MTENDSVELVKPGCLGTCWYGKYHYVEPWVGCEHSCTYCYAKFRTPVKQVLTMLKTDFENPEPIYETDRMLTDLANIADSGDIKIVKLSRFTDIFSPKFKKNGLSYEVLKILAQSKVSRIIITTKGVPDQKVITLMERYKEKFSYNTVAKPEADIVLEGSVAPIVEKLEVSSYLNKIGVLTTIHMDPIVPGMEDEENLLKAHLAKLKAYGLKRVMFSYLLLTKPMIQDISAKFGTARVNRILNCYDDFPKQYLPSEVETTYISYKPKLKYESIKRISNLLASEGFDYVLCSLKSGRNACSDEEKITNLCNGGFYA